MADSGDFNFNLSSNAPDTAMMVEEPVASSSSRSHGPVNEVQDTRRNVLRLTPVNRPLPPIGEPDKCSYMADCDDETVDTDDDDDEAFRNLMDRVKTVKPKRAAYKKAPRKHCKAQRKFKDLPSYFDVLAGTFRRRMICFENSNLLKTTISRGLQELLDSLILHTGGNLEISYKDLKIYFVCDSFLEVGWSKYPLDKVYSLDFQNKVIVLQDGTTVCPGLPSHYPVEENFTRDKGQHTSLGLKFSEFQHMLYKLILPSQSNAIYHTFHDGRPYEDIVVDCKSSNNFIYEYASAPARHTMKLAKQDYGGPSQTVELELDSTEFNEVCCYSLPLYAALLVHLHDAVSHNTREVSLLPVPDYVRLRLAYEITAHVYLERVKSEGDDSMNSKTLEDITNNLHMAVRSVIVTEPTKRYFQNLREDHKCLALFHCIFAQIRFSHTLRNYFESIW